VAASGPTCSAAAPLDTRPDVVAVVPARNEAALVGQALGSLLLQDYAGRLDVVLVDDHSSDGTADAASNAAAAAGASERLTIVAAPALAPGWAGKVAAMNAGLERAATLYPNARYILFTDADILHAPDAVNNLVARAERDGLDLASLMVRLRRESWAERALVPAFVFFFRLLYPFQQVNDRYSPVAAAAGGCMLVRREALEKAGGLERIKGELIDDCALAKLLKAGGPIRLDVAERSASLRAYPDFPAMWNLIARTAFTELRYSAARLAAALVLMTLVFLLPPYAALRCHSLAAELGAAAWAAMAVAYMPCLRYYRASMAWAPALPLIALFYTGATLHSALRHWLGHGAEWKGRVRGEE